MAGAVDLFRTDMLRHFEHGLAMIFLRDSFCLSAVSLSRQRHDILDFPAVLCHAFRNLQKFEFHLVIAICTVDDQSIN